MTPTFGSIVQKGKLAACALALLKQLKRVDFPTFGSPTIPHCKAINSYEIISKLLNKDYKIFEDAIKKAGVQNPAFT
ncbi:MAG: hypothetical protein ACRCZB_08115 [Bacteroidales bacterium]